MVWPIDDIMGGLTSLGQWFFSWFSDEEKQILEFLAPLVKQIRDEALKLGNDNVQAGLAIIENAALAAATAAVSAPPGTQVAAAEAAFLQIAATQGVTAIHNAEAAAIKAAVAIIQTQTGIVVNVPPVVPATTDTTPPIVVGS